MARRGRRQVLWLLLGVYGGFNGYTLAILRTYTGKKINFIVKITLFRRVKNIRHWRWYFNVKVIALLTNNVFNFFQ
jgi:hypothetical protein